MTNLDRAVGVLLAAAAGDALGVPYEYGSRPLPPVGEAPQMLGGGLGNYEPGQWSDDTEMACVIVQLAADGLDLRSPEALDRIADGFLGWFAGGPADIGNQTRAVLARQQTGPGSALRLRVRACELHERTGRSAGNGSLMRTWPVALAHLGDTAAIVDAARAVSSLTHFDAQAGDACVLWCLAIDHAVRTGKLDVRIGLPHVGGEWGALIDEAERGVPVDFSAQNGWVVAALQAAWSAVAHADGLVDGLEAAVRGGGDTDTVAAIAGALLGARFGGSAVPVRWRRQVHGWPGLRARDLMQLAVLSVQGPDADGWPISLSYPGARRGTVPHPDDPGVLMGAVGALRPGVATAVVSLCRLGADQVPLAGVAPESHVEVWLIDRDDANLDLGGVLTDAATAVRDLRAEGHTVLLHCVHAETRTPIVAARYGEMITGSSRQDALDRVLAVLPSAHPRPSILREFLQTE